jgi:16S rRNA (guanine1516-N2)-methyltransferase
MPFMVNEIDVLVFEEASLRQLAEDYVSEIGIRSHFLNLDQIRSKRKRLDAYKELTEKDFIFVLNLDGLHIQMLLKTALCIKVDFCSPQIQYRLAKGGGKSQMIAKALGLKSGFRPRVIDATAGLGKDAFVLASLGCFVQMYERNPLIQLLLKDGMRRARLSHDIKSNSELKEALERMKLKPSDVVEVFNQGISQFDVLYLDPMFPHPDSRSLVKKDMQLLQSLVGADSDASDVFKKAQSSGIARIVVKRPKSAPYLMDKKPDHSFVGKRNRFDVYHSAAQGF